MPEAGPSDVYDVIDTSLDSEEVQSYIDDVNEYLRGESALSELSTSEQRRLEKYAAALRIRRIRDRETSQDSIGDSQMSYQGTPIEALREEVSRLDPTGKLARRGVRDTTRHVNST